MATNREHLEQQGILVAAAAYTKSYPARCNYCTEGPNGCLHSKCDDAIERWLDATADGEEEG